MADPRFISAGCGGGGGEVRVILLKNLYLRMVFIGIFIQDRSDVSAIGNLCEKTQRVAKISGGSRIPGGSNLRGVHLLLAIFFRKLNGNERNSTEERGWGDVSSIALNPPLTIRKKGNYPFCFYF